MGILSKIKFMAPNMHRQIYFNKSVIILNFHICIWNLSLAWFLKKYLVKRLKLKGYLNYFCPPTVYHHAKIFPKKILRADYEIEACIILGQTAPKFIGLWDVGSTGDVHSKYILIILLIELCNFRKLRDNDFLNLN